MAGDTSALDAAMADPLSIPEAGVRAIARNLSKLHAVWADMSKDCRIELLNRAHQDYTLHAERWADLPGDVRQAITDRLHADLRFWTVVGADWLTSGRL